MGASNMAITVFAMGAIIIEHIQNQSMWIKRLCEAAILTLWLPGRGAYQDQDILVWEFYFSSFEAGIANAISSFKWRKNT